MKEEFNHRENTVFLLTFPIKDMLSYATYNKKDAFLTIDLKDREFAGNINYNLVVENSDRHFKRRKMKQAVHVFSNKRKKTILIIKEKEVNPFDTEGFKLIDIIQTGDELGMFIIRQLDDDTSIIELLDEDDAFVMQFTDWQKAMKYVSKFTKTNGGIIKFTHKKGEQIAL